MIIGKYERQYISSTIFKKAILETCIDLLFTDKSTCKSSVSGRETVNIDSWGSKIGSNPIVILSRTL